MTITPEERQQWRAAESPYSLDKRITRLLDALEKAEDDVEAAQIGQIAAYKLAEDDAAEEIAQLKERAEKAERERDVLARFLAGGDFPVCCPPNYDCQTLKEGVCVNCWRAYAAQAAAKEPAGEGK